MRTFGLPGPGCKRGGSGCITGSVILAAGGMGFIASTDRKSLLFGPESVSRKRAFPWAQSDKSGPGSQTRLPPEGWGPLNKGCERRTRALPDS
jgi:hypothetical protein